MASFTALCTLALALCLGLVQCQNDFDRDFGGRDLPPRDQTVPECREKVMDIYFVLDSSTSIWENDVESERQFARDVVSRLNVDARFTRVGILTFSDDIQRPTLGMSNFQTKSDVLASINVQNLPHRTGITNTHLAIRYVRENTEFREDITKVIVVITDGGSRSPGATAREAQLARENGFYLFVVGVGQYLDEREWQAIASDPDDSFIFNITNFRFLPTVRSSLAARACQLPPIIMGQCNVEELSDIYFAAGSSATTSSLQLLNQFAERTTDDDNALRMSIYMDACQNAVNVNLEDIGFYCDRFFDPSTSDPTPFRDLLSQLRTDARNARERGEQRQQVAVLFVDDETMRNTRFDFSQEARMLQRDGVELIVVDLGVRAYVTSLQSLPDDRENYVTFARGNIGSQQTAMREMITRTCNALNRFLIDGPAPQ